MNRDGVRLRQQPGDYGEKPIRRYKLTASLSAGGSAAAVFEQWDRNASPSPKYDDTSQTFTLYSGPNKATGNSGDYGYCAYFADRGQWEVIAGGGAGVKKVTFVLPMALTNQASVSGCPVLNDWYSNAGATQITVNNEAGWQGDAGAEGYAEYRPSDGTWPITLLPCPQGSS